MVSFAVGGIAANDVAGLSQTAVYVSYIIQFNSNMHIAFSSIHFRASFHVWDIMKTQGFLIYKSHWGIFS